MNNFVTYSHKYISYDSTLQSHKLLTSEKNHLLQGTGLDDMEVICFFQTFTK